jgi:hypothetical protein
MLLFFRLPSSLFRLSLLRLTEIGLVGNPFEGRKAEDGRGKKEKS